MWAMMDEFNTDPSDWATHFLAVFGDRIQGSVPDHKTLTVWFQRAIEAGRQEALTLQGRSR
jgi:hypothetical protein